MSGRTAWSSSSSITTATPDPSNPSDRSPNIVLSQVAGTEDTTTLTLRYSARIYGGGVSGQVHGARPVTEAERTQRLQMGTINSLLDDDLHHTNLFYINNTNVIAEPIPRFKPGVPTGLAATTFEDRINATWTAPATSSTVGRAEHYNLRYRKKGATAWRTTPDTTQTRAGISGVDYDAVYENCGPGQERDREQRLFGDRGGHDRGRPRRRTVRDARPPRNRRRRRPQRRDRPLPRRGATSSDVPAPGWKNRAAPLAPPVPDEQPGWTLRPAGGGPARADARVLSAGRNKAFIWSVASSRAPRPPKSGAPAAGSPTFMDMAPWSALAFERAEAIAFLDAPKLTGDVVSQILDDIGEPDRPAKPRRTATKTAASDAPSTGGTCASPTPASISAGTASSPMPCGSCVMSRRWRWVSFMRALATKLHYDNRWHRQFYRRRTNTWNVTPGAGAADRISALAVSPENSWENVYNRFTVRPGSVTATAVPIKLWTFRRGEINNLPLVIPAGDTVRVVVNLRSTDGDVEDVYVRQTARWIDPQVRGTQSVIEFKNNADDTNVDNLVTYNTPSGIQLDNTHRGPPGL